MITETQSHLIIVLVDLVELEDVLVVDLLHDVDLSLEELDVLLDHRLVDNLHGILCGEEGECSSSLHIV